MCGRDARAPVGMGGGVPAFRFGWEAGEVENSKSVTFCIFVCHSALGAWVNSGLIVHFMYPGDRFCAACGIDVCHFVPLDSLVMGTVGQPGGGGVT